MGLRSRFLYLSSPKVHVQIMRAQYSDSDIFIWVLTFQTELVLSLLLGVVFNFAPCDGSLEVNVGFSFFEGDFLGEHGEIDDFLEVDVREYELEGFLGEAATRHVQVLEEFL